MKKKKTLTKKEIDKITKSISSRGDLIQFLFITAIKMEEDSSDKVANTLLSIYTMGYIAGMGFDEDDVSEMLRDEREVN